MAAKKTNRCWPGYEPVPGKEPNSQGSCRPKADSKSTPAEKQFKADRRKQLDEWHGEHKKAPRQAAQHLHGPKGEPSSQKGAAKTAKSPARKKKTKASKTPVSAAKKKSTTRQSPAKKTAKQTRASARRKAA